MLSHSTSVRIVSLIEAIADTEIQVEIVRQVLCEKSSFEPFTAFKEISKPSTKISWESLLAFMQKRAPKLTRADAEYLINLFDSDKDGMLSYPEFFNIILPRSNSKLRSTTASKGTLLQSKDQLSYDLEHALMRIFEEELHCYSECEKIRKGLAVCKDFSIMGAFKAIDTRDRGYFNITDVAKFVEKTHRSVEDAHLMAFLIRADKDGDGLVKFSEFMGLFLLKEDSSPAQQNQRQQTPKPRVDVPPRVKGGKDEVLEQLRDRYSSPRRGYHSPSKVKNSEEELHSSTSTKASSSNKLVKTTPKENKGQRVTFDFSQSKRNDCDESPMQTSKPRNALKPEDEVQLAQALKKIIKAIEDLEGVKNELAVRKDFNLYNAFAIFDVEKKGGIDKKQLYKGLKRLDVKPSEDELYLLMKKLDSDCDDVIKFGDFSHLATPKSEECAKKMSVRLPYYVSNLNDPLKAFGAKTILALRNFWRTLIEGEVALETIRQRLLAPKKFNLLSAFNTLDKENKGYISVSQFKDFLAANKVSFKQEEVNMLMEKYAKSSKGKASYEDFVRTMTPKSPKRY